MTCMLSLKLGGAQEVNEHVGFQPGVPVKPMLAKPTTGVSEVPALTACYCETWAGCSCVSFATFHMQKLSQLTSQLASTTCGSIVELRILLSVWVMS